MRQLGQMKKSTKNSLFTYTLVIAAFVVVQALRMGPGVGAMLEGQLIPICAYIVMALALNLVVGVSGELSLGHAGFMSIGAFAGSALALALQSTVTLSPLRLALAMVFGAVIAAALGFLIGIPVLRLNGDYLAIVTLPLARSSRASSPTSTWAWMKTASSSASSPTKTSWPTAGWSSSAAPWA